MVEAVHLAADELEKRAFNELAVDAMLFVRRVSGNFPQTFPFCRGEGTKVGKINDDGLSFERAEVLCHL